MHGLGMEGKYESKEQVQMEWVDDGNERPGRYIGEGGLEPETQGLSSCEG